MVQREESQTSRMENRNDTLWRLGTAIGIAAVVGGLVLAFGGPIAGIAVLMALVAAGAVLRDIEVGFWGVVIVICLVPFATIPVDIGLTPTLLDLVLGATVGIWILRLVTGRRRQLETSVITVPIVIFLIVTVFAFVAFCIIIPPAAALAVPKTKELAAVKLPTVPVTAASEVIVPVY